MDPRTRAMAGAAPTRRQALMLGAGAALASGPGAALAQGNAIPPSVLVKGRLSAGTAGRFARIVRENLGNVLSLDLTGREADEPGGVFDLGEGQTGVLVFEHRAGGRLTTIKTGLFDRQANGAYRILGLARVVEDRAGLRNASAFVLEETVGPADSARRPPVVTL